MMTPTVHVVVNDPPFYTAISRLLKSLLLLVFAIGLAYPAAADPLPRSVLIFDQSDSSSPWGLAFRAALRSTLTKNTTTPITVYTEVLELARFNSPQYEDFLRRSLREKYQDRPIGAIVVHGSVALQVLLRLRAELWPSVPVVFTFVDPQTLAELTLPPDVTGTTFRMPFKTVVVAARALVPNLKRIALVGARFVDDPFRPHLAEELSSFDNDLELINLLGLPITEVRSRLATLPNDTAVYYSNLWIDDTGTHFIPAEVVPLLAEVSNRPIVSGNVFHLGRGITGGFLALPEPMAEQSAKQAVRILDGEPAARIPITAGDFAKPIFDWRELQRWNLSEASLPPGSEVRFRPPTMWEQYRWQTITISVALLLQGVIISWLLFERHRRRRAELESRGRMLEVIHLNRSAAAGALSASIAHELNQPLGAILSNAEAAELLLKSSTPDLAQVKEILGDIREADQRAADIIHHLRKLLKRTTETEPRQVDLNDAIAQALRILSPEAAKRGIALSTNGIDGAVPVRADQIHLEQVILNLASNGMDAMSACDNGARRMTIQTTLTEDEKVEVSVIDSGTGIPKEKLKEVFDTFYTTKQQGTGLGLSIARTIIETYGGKIWAENLSGGGAVFRFTLPLSEPRPA